MSAMYKTIKTGRLFCLPIECPDLSSFFLVRLFRKFNLTYIPWTLKFYNRLYLREDKSKQSRTLIDYCRKKGIITVVVQEGAMYKRDSFTYVPLYADYLLSPKDDYDWWCTQLPKERVLYFHPQRETQDYEGIVFLHPLFEYGLHFRYWDRYNSTVMCLIDKFIHENVVFKLHPHNQDLVRHFIPPHRIVNGDPRELMRKYDKIYCFSDSSIRKECELVGKNPILVDI